MSKTVSGQELSSGYADHPDHTVSTEPAKETVTVWLGDKMIARSSNALKLHEAGYLPAYYIPRADADMTLLEPSGRKTWCPFKGHASYYSILRGNGSEADAVWSYEDPFTEIGEIKDHLGFYPNKVRIQTENT